MTARSVARGALVVICAPLWCAMFLVLLSHAVAVRMMGQERDEGRERAR